MKYNRSEINSGFNKRIKPADSEGSVDHRDRKLSSAPSEFTVSKAKFTYECNSAL